MGLDAAEDIMERCTEGWRVLAQSVDERGSDSVDMLMNPSPFPGKIWICVEDLVAVMMLATARSHPGAE